MQCCILVFSPNRTGNPSAPSLARSLRNRQVRSRFQLAKDSSVLLLRSHWYNMWKRGMLEESEHDTDESETLCRSAWWFRCCLVSSPCTRKPEQIEAFTPWRSISISHTFYEHPNYLKETNPQIGSIVKTDKNISTLKKQEQLACQNTATAELCYLAAGKSCLVGDFETF